MRGSKKFCHWGSNSDNVDFLFLFFVLVDVWRPKDLTNTKSGSSLAHQRNVNDSVTMNAGLVAFSFSSQSGQVLIKQPIFL